MAFPFSFPGSLPSQLPAGHCPRFLEYELLSQFAEERTSALSVHLPGEALARPHCPVLASSALLQILPIWSCVGETSGCITEFSVLHLDMLRSHSHHCTPRLVPSGLLARPEAALWGLRVGAGVAPEEGRGTQRA